MMLFTGAPQPFWPEAMVSVGSPDDNTPWVVNLPIARHLHFPLLNRARLSLWGACFPFFEALLLKRASQAGPSFICCFTVTLKEGGSVSPQLGHDCCPSVRREQCKHGQPSRQCNLSFPICLPQLCSFRARVSLHNGVFTALDTRLQELRETCLQLRDDVDQCVVSLACSQPCSVQAKVLLRLRRRLNCGYPRAMHSLTAWSATLLQIFTTTLPWRRQHMRKLSQALVSAFP